MAHVFSRAVVLEPVEISSPGEALFKTVETLKQAGYRVCDAGDGLSGRIIDRSDSGDRGFGNDYAWQRIASPDAAREWTIQVVSAAPTAGAVRIRYAMQSPFEHGVTSPTRAPVSLMQMPLIGGGTEDIPTGSPLYSWAFKWTQSRLFGVAATQAPYNFWFAVVRGPQKIVHHTWVFDPVGASREDRDPSVQILNGAIVAWHAGKFRRLVTNGPTINLDKNPYNGRPDLFPVMYGDENGLKGTSTTALWNPGEDGRGFTDAATSRQYLSLGEFVLPWESPGLPGGYESVRANVWTPPDDGRPGMLAVQRRQRGGNL